MLRFGSSQSILKNGEFKKKFSPYSRKKIFKTHARNAKYIAANY